MIYLNFIMEHWEAILGAIIALLGIFKFKVNEETKKDLEIFLSFLNEIISDLKIKNHTDSATALDPKKVVDILREKAERSTTLNKVITKIDNTKGDKLVDVVEVVLHNHKFLQKAGKTIFGLFKSFMIPFGKKIF